MDKTVILLIGAGVCCIVIGVALFIKLMTSKNTESADISNKKLLDSEYKENFKECFENTGSIEETLEQLADIYTGNQYMYNLIINAIEYIREGEGDYETALDSINVDSDMEIMKMHTNAIKKSLNIHTDNETEYVEASDFVDEFDEDNDENVDDVIETVENTEKVARPTKKVKKKPEKRTLRQPKQEEEAFVEYGDDDSDDDDFKI